MKIYYLANARLPTEKAHGYQICKMCAEFARAGATVILIAPDRARPGDGDIFSYYGLERNFTVKLLPLPAYPRLEGWLGPRWPYRLLNWHFLYKLACQTIEKDAVVYTRQPEIARLFGRRGWRSILEAHSLPIGQGKSFRRALQHIERFIVVTRTLGDQLQTLGVPAEKIIWAPDGVDLKIFAQPLNKKTARSDFGLPLDKIILGYTGSFRTMGEDKGIGDILAALAKLDAQYYFAAVGGNEADIKDYKIIAKNLGVSERTAFRARVNLQQLSRFQQACDILLMPFPDIRHYREHMSPLKMFEYMASGRPIIASDLPSIREILNESNCLLVKPNDPADLAEKIRLLATDKNLADRLAVRAQQDAKQYDWRKRAEKILKFIDKTS
ncbi:hypothetical protein COX22_00035 [Candidatus Falkowbacteria bacterium CG23_combo_of_CG06-09_8_20_14_all_49_15]|uniref:Uncharacterized protein n=1 Tax=Candidatus Falkowbacteria bacterium CG23_combo_of_CG06-09_8_20_14_all_49_15 TaxID=1974572 RepID=A0A2G9ZM30_9BACT|nr:MAG: hypothetical protein COX22_00035 [Candidatus Falkowbacteria bacterium CG23_combo_of_CG06-09_8_20_14_all_49_15]